MPCRPSGWQGVLLFDNMVNKYEVSWMNVECGVAALYLTLRRSPERIQQALQCHLWHGRQMVVDGGDQ